MKAPSLIHILSDSPANAEEKSIYEAWIYRQFPAVRIVHSSTNAVKGDLRAASVFTRMLIPEFEEGTFHFCVFSIPDKLPEKYLATNIDGQIIFAPDNGIINLYKPDAWLDCYTLPMPAQFKDVVRDIYLPGAMQYAQTQDISTTGEANENFHKMFLPMALKNGNNVRLEVMYNDAHGNAYLNITRKEFEKLTGNDPFELRIGTKETIRHIAPSVYGLTEGRIYATFGIGDILQLYMHNGSAKQYYSLSPGTLVLLYCQVPEKNTSEKPFEMNYKI